MRKQSAISDRSATFGENQRRRFKITSRTKSSALTIGIIGLMASLLRWTAAPVAVRVKMPHHAVTRAQPAEPFTAPVDLGLRMLNHDEMRVIAACARRIEAMMSVSEDALTKVMLQGLRDPDGRLGIIIACSQPFVTPTNTPGMDERKQWVMLAVFAVVKHAAGSPVKVDYIGLTDSQGVSGGRWFYELDMRKARLMQQRLLTRAITMEQGYDSVVAAWHRVTPAERSESPSHIKSEAGFHPIPDALRTF